MTSMRLLRALTFCLLGGIALTLLSYAALLLLNWRDDPVSAAAQHFTDVHTTRRAVPDQQNAYLYMLGFEAADDQSPIDLGRKRIDWLRWALDQPWNESLQEPEYSRRLARDDEQPLFVESLVEACRSNNGQCAARLLASEARLDEWLKSAQPLLQRYQALIVLPAMYEPLPFDMRSSLPSYRPVLQGQQLLLVHAWQLHRQGASEQARQLLESDLRFWRMALAEADTLISRLIAVSAVRQHLLWSVQMFRGQPSGWQPEVWSLPLSAEERNWERVLAGEMAFMKGLLQQMKHGELDWVAAIESDNSLQNLAYRLGAPLLLPQRSLNDQAQLLQSQQSLFELPYSELAGAQERSRNLEHSFVPQGIGVAELRNLAGHLLRMQGGDNDLTEYYLRVSDLEGLRRAALLLVEMRDLKLDPQQAMIHTWSSPLRDPYRDKPFAWEAQQGLRYQGLSKEEPYLLVY
jgi:hypothetical protein